MSQENEQLNNMPLAPDEDVSSELVSEVLQEEIEQENLQNQVPKADVSAPDVQSYDMVTVSPVEFSSFDNDETVLSKDTKKNLDILQDVKMHITVELGRARCSVKKILDFQKGSIVELNKVAGEQVELYANGKFVAYGEVIVIEDKFGLRVTSIANKPKNN